MNQTPSDFQYEEIKQLTVHPVITIFAEMCLKAQPNLPGDLTRKISEELGLPLNEETLCKIISHFCDFKVNKVMNTIQDHKKTKKSLTILSKADVIKALSLDEHKLLIEKQNIYPLFGLEQTKCFMLQKQMGIEE